MEPIIVNLNSDRPTILILKKIIQVYILLRLNSSTFQCFPHRDDGFTMETEHDTPSHHPHATLDVIFYQKYHLSSLCQRKFSCCFTSTVNRYGHVGMVSYPNQPFLGTLRPMSLTSTSCTYFHQ